MSDASSPPTASEPLLELVHVTKRYGGLPAVDDLSFSVRQGEVLGVIGPNGAGKSTMIGLIGGAIAPTAGTVRFAGADISRLAPNRRAHLGIARTFQVTQPFAGLDVRENVLVGASFGRGGRSRAQAMRQTEAVLERVGLTAKARLRGNQLTVADRKRLEVARALATEPQLLMLDEVMAGLNPAEVSQAIAMIRGISQSGVTVIVIEHIVRAIASLSDRILVLHHGRKIAEDLPNAVLADPKVIEAYLGERYAKERQAKGQAAPADEAWREGLA